MGKALDKIKIIYESYRKRKEDRKSSFLKKEFLMKILKEDEVIKYYAVLRDEIEREDGITATRLSSMLTFQGFLVSAVGLLMTNGWSSAQPLTPDLLHLREWLLLLLGLVGLVMAGLTHKGIRASGAALDVAKGEWEEVLRLYHTANPDEQITAPDSFDDKKLRLALFPRAYGTRTDGGGKYGVVFPHAFMLIWAVYMILCICFLPDLAAVRGMVGWR